MIVQDAMMPRFTFQHRSAMHAGGRPSLSEWPPSLVDGHSGERQLGSSFGCLSSHGLCTRHAEMQQGGERVIDRPGGCCGVPIIT